MSVGGGSVFSDFESTGQAPNQTRTPAAEILPVGLPRTAALRLLSASANSARDRETVNRIGPRPVINPDEISVQVQSYFYSF
jgi:hypothetical protein